MDTTIKDPILDQENKKAQEVIKIISNEISRQEEFMNNTSKQSLEALKELRGKGLTSNDLIEAMRLIQEDIDSVNVADILAKKQELQYLENNPFFARMDLLNKNENLKEEFYLAKFGLYEGTRPILLDWRTKVASLYYKNKYQRKNVGFVIQGVEFLFDLLLKRTFEFENKKVIKYFNNDLNIDENEIISGKIQKRTGGVLEDIIETIQENQMNIIEADPREVCIVQGTVGSGKSTVAIHKLSYIFFNYPNLIQPSKTLLISKSRVLVDYLSSLFPRLGIFDVKYKTVRDIVFKYLTENPIKVKFNLSLNTDISKINAEFFDNLQSTVLKHKENCINEIKNLMSETEFENLTSFKFNLTAPIGMQIDEMLLEITESVDLIREQNSFLSPNELKFEKNKITISKLTLLKKKIKSEKNNLIIHNFKSILSEYGIDKFLGYQESLIFLYIYSEFYGFTEKDLYDYGVVDEAQDMCILETYLISKLVKNKRLCLIGDLNQNIHNNPVAKWEDIFHIFEGTKVSTYQLETNYRSTKNIVNFANSILKPFTASYLPKYIEREGPEVSNYIYNQENLDGFLRDFKKDLENLDKSIGVIFYEFQDEDIIREKLLNITTNPEKLIWLQEYKTTVYEPRAVYLTDFNFCKGLEFSKVYLFGFPNTPKNFEEAKKYFVGITRAMNELVIYNTNK